MFGAIILQGMKSPPLFGVVTAAAEVNNANLSSDGATLITLLAEINFDKLSTIILSNSNW